MSLQNGLQTISLIKPEAIKIHLKHLFRFTHIGLVQVAVKPFIRKADNVPIYMALRDKRLTKYKSSLLARSIPIYLTHQFSSIVVESSVLILHVP